MLVERLMEGIVEMVVENEVTGDGSYPQWKASFEQLPTRCTRSLLTCEIKHRGQVKHLSLPRSLAKQQLDEAYYCLGRAPAGGGGGQGKTKKGPGKGKKTG
jgi:hypothetical protein